MLLTNVWNFITLYDINNLVTNWYPFSNETVWYETVWLRNDLIPIHCDRSNCEESKTVVSN